MIKDQHSPEDILDMLDALLEKSIGANPLRWRRDRREKFQALSKLLNVYSHAEIVGALAPLGDGRFRFVEEAIRDSGYIQGNCPNCRLGDVVAGRNRVELPEQTDAETGERIPSEEHFYSIVACSAECQPHKIAEVRRRDYDAIALQPNFDARIERIYRESGKLLLARSKQVL